MTLVGVMTPGFTGIGPIPPDFWAPVTLYSRLQGADDLFGAAGPPVLWAVVRLTTGADAAATRAALATWATRETASRPDSLRWTRVDLDAAGKAMPLTPEIMALFTPAGVAFLLVLLIACANVANVMLARGVARQREIGIRLALGATRRQLVRQLLTESVRLAIPASALGFVLSQWILDAGVRIMYASAPGDFVPYLRAVPLSSDLRVFGFVLLAGLASAFAFGLLPALQITRTNVVQASHGEFGTVVRPGRLRAGLLVGQIGVCSLLLIVTGVLLGGARTADRLPTGMRTRDVVRSISTTRGVAPRSNGCAQSSSSAGSAPRRRPRWTACTRRLACGRPAIRASRWRESISSTPNSSRCWTSRSRGAAPSRRRRAAGRAGRRHQ